MRALLPLLGWLPLVGCSDDSTTGGSGGSGGGSTSAVTSTATGLTATGATTTTGATSVTGATTSTGGADPFATARAACIARINELRATKGRPPLAEWTSGNACADVQATSDEQTNSPHGAFGDCGEGGQNECLGHGPNGIESCLDSMWAEKDQAGCSGCDACADAYTPNCPNCDFLGNNTGDVCGHYVNMSANYFTEVSCGFSSLGGWNVINFR